MGSKDGKLSCSSPPALNQGHLFTRLFSRGGFPMYLQFLKSSEGSEQKIVSLATIHLNSSQCSIFPSLVKESR